MTSRMWRVALVLTSVSVCPAVDLSAVAGTYKPYLDERAGWIAGGSVRIPVSRRAAIRPEVLAGSISTYSHVLGLASMTYDFTDPAKVAVGYAVGGVGGVRTLDHWGYSGLAVLGGVGTRFALPGPWIGAAEFRLGSAAFPMITLSVGYRWRRGE
jgi:hypothetical protein